MKITIDRLDQLVKSGLNYLGNCSEKELAIKPAPEKWSKKEILGHLIDSAIHNLQRFTEIQFENKPYQLRKYNQNEMVKAHNYQHAEVKELVQLWKALNVRIHHVMKQQTQITLNYKIELDEKKLDLKFLMSDYVDHLEHHLNQILK